MEVMKEDGAGEEGNSKKIWIRNGKEGRKEGRKRRKRRGRGH